MSRVGVFTCCCGENIARTVDVPKVAREAARLAGVCASVHCGYMCSDPGQTLLRETSADIRGLLERAEGDSSRPHPSTTERLEETIAHLEVTHPDLTLMLSELLSILSNAGI